jgi:hypothetical protein
MGQAVPCQKAGADREYLLKIAAEPDGPGLSSIGERKRPSADRRLDV